jgi:hypothetical protein
MDSKKQRLAWVALSFVSHLSQRSGKRSQPQVAIKKSRKSRCLPEAVPRPEQGIAKSKARPEERANSRAIKGSLREEPG